MLALDDELVVVGGDELDVHRLGALAAANVGRRARGGLHALAHLDSFFRTEDSIRK